MPYLLIFEDTRSNAYQIRAIASSQPFFMGDPYLNAYTIIKLVKLRFSKSLMVLDKAGAIYCEIALDENNKFS